jgi:NAD(P)-dependent dehydrogenase (short-subunit alcohol dehydrogenase family)
MTKDTATAGQPSAADAAARSAQRVDEIMPTQKETVHGVGRDSGAPTYVVVGAGPGIGLATAKAFAKQGWHTVLVGRSTQSLEKVAAALLAAVPSAPLPQLVVADAEEPVSLKIALDDAGIERVDVAHFNVSLWVPGGYESSLVEVTAGVKTGVISAMAMAQSLVPQLIASPGRGLLMMTGGGTADDPMAASVGLGLQKAALRNLAIALGRELDPEHLRVSTVTIYGTVKAQTPFAPDAIAAKVAEIYEDAQVTDNDSWSIVTEYRG